MNFQVEDFGPTICSTPSQDLNTGLAFRGARTPPTLPLLPTQGQNQEQFSIPNPELALATTSSSTSTQLIPRYKHTVEVSDIKKMDISFGKAPEVDLGLALLTLSKSSRKPKPREIEMESKVDSNSTNGKTGKGKAGLSDSPNAIRQRKY